jgi:hypothetical protein
MARSVAIAQQELDAVADSDPAIAALRREWAPGMRLIVDWPDTPVHNKHGVVLDVLDRKSLSVRLEGEWSADDLIFYRSRGLPASCVKHHLGSLTHLQNHLKERNELNDEDLKLFESRRTESNYTEPKEIRYEKRAILDTGCCDSHVPNSEYLIPGSLYELKSPIKAKGPGGQLNEITHAGILCIWTNAERVRTGFYDTTRLLDEKYLSSLEESGEVIVDRHCYWTPGYDRILVAGSSLDDRGYFGEFGGGKMCIRRTQRGPDILVLPRLKETSRNTLRQSKHYGKKAIPPSERGKLYVIPDKYFMDYGDSSEANQVSQPNGDITECCLAIKYSGKDSLDQDHELDGHHSYGASALMRAWDSGKPVDPKHKGRWCAHCMCGKSHEIWARQSAPMKIWELLEGASADLSTDMPVSKRGFKHYLVIVEFSTNKHWIFYLKRRSEAKVYMLFWLRYAKAKYHALKNLYIDGGELNCQEIIDEMSPNTVHTNLAGAHEQNARAERGIGAINDLERTMRHAGGAPKSFWIYSTNCAVAAKNRMPSLRELKRSRRTKGATRPLTPNEKWEKRQFKSYEEQRRHVAPAFCRVVAHVKKEARPKRLGEMPGMEAIYLCPIHPNLVGSQPNVKQHGHLVMKERTGQVFKVQHVRAHLGEYPLRERKAHALPPLTVQATTSDALELEEFADLTPSSPLPIISTPPVPDQHEIAMETKEGDENGESSEHNNDELPAGRTPHVSTPSALPPPLESLTPHQVSVLDISESLDEPEQLLAALDELDDEVAELACPESGTEEGESAESERVPLRRSSRTRDGHAVAPWLKEQNEERIRKQQELDRRHEQTSVPYKQGDIVETRYGPAIYHKNTARGVELSWEQDEANVRYVMDREHVWLPGEREEKYNYEGELILPNVDNAESPRVTSVNHVAPLAGSSYFCESYHSEPMRRKRSEVGPPPVIPRKELQKMPASQVEKLLPRHHSQLYWSPLRDECCEAEEEELQGMVMLPLCGVPRRLKPGEQAIDLLWVYTTKELEGGNFSHVKSRLAMMGNQERHTLCKMDAYAPVANPATYRVQVALHVGMKGVRFRQMDVSQAYLSTLMKRRVLIRHPPGYMFFINEASELDYRRLKPGEPRPTTGLPLLRALYGGMECGRLFYDEWMDYHVRVLGFQKSEIDPCFLQKVSEDGLSFIKIVFHVDDGLVVTRGEEMYEQYKSDLKKRFSFKEGPLKKLLGMEFEVSPDSVKIRLEGQIQKMLRDFGMEDAKHEQSPIPTTSNYKLPCESDIPTDTAELKRVQDSFDMQQCVGHLNFIQMVLRGDISCPLKVLSKHPVKFGKKHVHLAKHVMCFLKATARQPLILRAGFARRCIQIFTDASHAGDTDTRKSVSGIVIKIGGNTVTWASLFQRIVSHSSCESELMALDKGATIGQHIKWLAEQMGADIISPIHVFIDNQSTINISSNPVQAGRNLHVHARYFYVRDLVYAKEYELLYLPSADQLGDLLCSFKGAPSYRRLAALFFGCARVEQSSEGGLVWNTRLLQD